EQLIARTKAGMAHAKRRDVHVGRPGWRSLPSAPGGPWNALGASEAPQPLAATRLERQRASQADPMTSRDLGISRWTVWAMAGRAVHPRSAGAAGFAVGRKEQSLVLHDTRRCARTNLSAADVPDVVARSITGHRTASMETRYNITQEIAQRAALAAVDRIVKAGRGARGRGAPGPPGRPTRGRP